MKKIITHLDYYNPTGVGSLDEKIFDLDGKAKACGLTNFNKSKYEFDAKNLDLMIACFWTMGEVNTAGEKDNFNKLSFNEQQVYKLTFAQLSLNDSLQTSFLIDFSSKVNNKVMKDSIGYQTGTEVVHSRSYSVLLDTAGNDEEIFGLFKTDDALSRKNERIAMLFARHVNGNTARQLVLSAIASVCLEGVFFLTGFAFIHVMGDKVPGARDMIGLISRDEAIHLNMFADMTAMIMSENGLLGNRQIIDDIHLMLKEAADIELEYAYYILDKFPIVGLTKELVRIMVQNYVNQRCAALGIANIYEVNPTTNLERMVKLGMNPNGKRTNFFEGTVSNYSKEETDMDDF